MGNDAITMGTIYLDNNRLTGNSSNRFFETALLPQLGFEMWCIMSGELVNLLIISISVQRSNSYL